MLVVTVELLHGTFRADPYGTAHTGGLTHGEWPPSPARLFAAFVAADGTRDRCRVTTGAELDWLERSPPPVIHAQGRPVHQLLLPRYVVRADKSPQKASHLEYVGRTGVEIRPGVRVSPRHRVIAFEWDVAAPAEVVEGLRRRAARIGYLGTADSPVRVRVGAHRPARLISPDSFVPDDSGDVEVCVPAPGHVRILDAMYDAWRKQGPSLARAQFPALRHEVTYRSPSVGEGASASGRVAAWLRIGRAVSGRRVSTVTALFKRALLSKYQEMYGEPPSVLHGHGFRGGGYDLARYLALPDAGFRRSRGRIHGLALWLPPECDGTVRRRGRTAVHALGRLYGGGVEARLEPVHPNARSSKPVAATPWRWTKAARSWVTVFPAVHERRGRLDLAGVAKWCQHAGLPAPVAFRSTRSPLVRGGVDLAPVEVNLPGRPRMPYSHVQLWFGEPVRGPVVVGAARQRGLGFCAPVPETDSADA